MYGLKESGKWEEAPLNPTDASVSAQSSGGTFLTLAGTYVGTR
jgi:hypothetical protein